MKANFSFSHGFSLWILFSFSFCGLSVSALKKYYAEDLCDKKSSFGVIQLNGYRSSAVLASTGGMAFTSCDILVKARQSSSVLLSIKSYNLTSSDELIIEDSDYHKVQLLGRREFLDERKTISSEGRINIIFTPDHGNPHLKKNFEFVLTQISNGPCTRDEFQCDTKQCIESSLVCDGHNHCGDRSDQKNCGPKNDRNSLYDDYVKEERPTVSVWAISITVGGAILGIVIIVFLAIVIRGIVKKKKEEQGSGTVLPTVAATVPPHPSAPTDPHPHPNYWNRIRNSFRSVRNPQAAESSPRSDEVQMAEEYQVPSMYPQIHSPTAPELNGVDNPDFKAEE